jgi:hypothetical protein
MLLQSIPGGRDDRWQLAIEFAEHWIRPLGEADRVSSSRLDATEARLGLRLPGALRGWYENLGCQRDIWSLQDHFLPPESLKLRSDLLIFVIENQSNWYIGILPDDLSVDDPPVTMDGRGLGEGIWTLSPSVSLMALQWLAYAIKFARPEEKFSVGLWTEATLEAIEGHYAPTALPPLYLFGQETFHYEGLDALIEVSGEDGFLYPSFRSDGARRDFERVVANTGFEWQM